MSMHFVPVKTRKQIGELAAMADLIWHEYFPAILSGEQIDYMVRTFQSAPAISKQLTQQGYQYFFMETDGINVGYTCVRQDTDRLFISKLYLLKEQRGHGYAGEAFRFYENLCGEKNLTVIWLTVNRNNLGAIRVYEAKGFKTVRTQVTDIGSGFVMDDYVMEKILDTATD